MEDSILTKSERIKLVVAVSRMRRHHLLVTYSLDIKSDMPSRLPKLYDMLK